MYTNKYLIKNKLYTLERMSCDIKERIVDIKDCVEHNDSYDNNVLNKINHLTKSITRINHNINNLLEYSNVRYNS